MRRVISVFRLILVLTGLLVFAFNIQLAKAEGTIYIRADGSVDPPTVLIQRDGCIYALTGNICGSIVVERNDIIFDGQNYSLQGNWTDKSIGLDLTERKNVTVKNLDIKQFCYGISLKSSINNSMSGNNITANNQTPFHNVKEAGHGIRIINSMNNSIFGNRIRNNWYGIRIINSTNNDVSGNCISDNDEGIQLYESSNNNICGNMFVNDGLTVYGSYENVVDDNWVNGKSLVYLEDVSDRIIEDAGQVILVNCSHIKARNSTLSNTTTGVQLSQTESTEISGNNITANSDLGIQLYESSDNSIFGNCISDNDEGIQLYESSDNNIFSNNVTANIWDGIQLYESSNNNIFSNSMTANNQSGIRLYQSSNNNSIFGNCISDNDEGIRLIQSSVDNVIYHNNFIDNTLQVYPSFDPNFWDAGYPSGGNYWGSQYKGADIYSGLYQNETGSDGIGDTPASQDNYPLMGMFNSYNVTYFTPPIVPHACNVSVISNSTISDFAAPVWIEHPENILLQFNVTGAEGSTGFCRVTFPTAMMNGTYHVFVNGTEVSYTLLPCSDANTSYLYFTYTHSTQEVIIISEFPAAPILSLFMTLSILAVALANKKKAKLCSGHTNRARKMIAEAYLKTFFY